MNPLYITFKMSIPSLPYNVFLLIYFSKFTILQFTGCSKSFKKTLPFFPANLRKSALTKAIFLLLVIYKVHAAATLDATDECILICDRCYRNDVLLDCANDCLFTSGNIHQRWKTTCPYFDYNVPSVQQVV